MCLHYDEETTKKALKGKKKDKDGFVKVWKVVERHRDSFGTKRLVSPLKKNHTWGMGWNESNRKCSQTKPTMHEINFGKIDNGIHVFLRRKEAREYVKILLSCHSSRDIKIIPVYVEEKDFVAAGYTFLYWYDCGVGGAIAKNRIFEKSAVFSSVFLKTKDYDKALDK